MAGFYPVKHWMAGYNLMLWDVKKYRCGGERGNLTFVFNPQTPDPKFNPNLLKKK
jgi:hypothetical protein